MGISIYKLYWDNCSYYYIGSSKNVKSRFIGHSSTLKRGVHNNKNLQRVYSEYGYPTFEILESCDDHERYDREKFYLEQAIGDVFCTNVYFEPKGKGKVISKEARRSASNKLKGRKFSETHIENLKKKVKRGEYHPNFGMTPTQAKWVINTQTGEIHRCSRDLVLNGTVQMSESNFKAILNGSVKTNPTPYEYLETYVANGSRRREVILEKPNAKKVINVLTGDIYNSAKSVVNEGLVDFRYSHFASKLNGRSTNNTPFMYLENYENQTQNNDITTTTEQSSREIQYSK